MSAETTTPRSAEPRRAPRLPPRWIIRSIWWLHRAAYSVTGGRFGLRSATADRAGYLILETVGRRTGKQRRRILGYVEDGPDLVTLAMNGWGEGAPAWWLNLQTHPVARIVLPDGTHAVTARVADPEERARLWAKLNGSVWGDLDGYAVRRTTETPIVIFERPG